MTKFSVIVPTYNRVQMVTHAIDSVLVQTYQDFELLVVDDGSTDNTPDLLQRYGDRIRYFRQSNSGVGAARNRGIKESQHEYLAFLDSDDQWYPHKLERVAETIRSNADVGLFYSDFDLVDQAGHLLRTQRCKHIVGNGYFELLLYNYIGTSTTVVKRECFVERGMFDEGLTTSQDWDMWIRIAKEYAIAHIPDTLVAYTWQAADSLSVIKKEPLVTWRRIVERALEVDPDLTPSQRKEIEAMLCRREGLVHYRQNDREAAVASLLRSTRLAPQQWKSPVYLAVIGSGLVDHLPARVKRWMRL